KQVAVLGGEQDRPEVLPVVGLVAEQGAGELDHGFRGVKFAWGRLPGLAHDGPGCNLQAVTLRVHFWTPGVVGRAEALGRAPALGRLRMAPRPCPSVPPSRPRRRSPRPRGVPDCREG